MRMLDMATFADAVRSRVAARVESVTTVQTTDGMAALVVRLPNRHTVTVAPQAGFTGVLLADDVATLADGTTECDAMALVSVRSYADYMAAIKVVAAMVMDAATCATFVALK